MWKDSIVFLGTNDLDDTHRFYAEILGLEFERDQGLCRIYRVPGGGGIAFCCHLPVVKEGKSPILTLITEDVDGACRRLKKRGVEPEEGPKTNPDFDIYHFFIRDPNGYNVEVQRFL